MKEQVARILGNMAHEIEQCDCKDPVLGLEIKQATQQICRLSQERVDGIFREIEEHLGGDINALDGLPVCMNLMSDFWQALKKKELK